VAKVGGFSLLVGVAASLKALGHDGAIVPQAFRRNPSRQLLAAQVSSLSAKYS